MHRSTSSGLTLPPTTELPASGVRPSCALALGPPTRFPRSGHRASAQPRHRASPLDRLRTAPGPSSRWMTNPTKRASSPIVSSGSALIHRQRTPSTTSVREPLRGNAMTLVPCVRGHKTASARDETVILRGDLAAASLAARRCEPTRRRRAPARARARTLCLYLGSTSGAGGPARRCTCPSE